jgi:hypothetical protein
VSKDNEVQATFTVTLTVKPDEYGDEYGEEPSAQEAVQHAYEMLKNRMSSDVHINASPNDSRLPSFAENHGHWAKFEVGPVEIRNEQDAR